MEEEKKVEINFTPAEMVVKARGLLHEAVDSMFNKIEGDVRCTHCKKDIPKCEYAVELDEKTGEAILGMVMATNDTFQIINTYLAQGREKMPAKAYDAMEAIMHSHRLSVDYFSQDPVSLLMKGFEEDPEGTLEMITDRLLEFEEMGREKDDVDDTLPPPLIPGIGSDYLEAGKDPE